MTQQERIEHNFRLTLGDLHIQLIVANAKIAELEAQIAAAELDKQEPLPGEALPVKGNGKGKDAVQ